MSQAHEKYTYFTVGLLKDSSTLETLWQDALKYHMIDQPDKLIALRLTEYYDLLAQGNSHAGAALSNAKSNGTGKASMNTPGSNVASSLNDYPLNNENVVTASPDADQNAADAADYWTNL
jgi:hypothetical protein